MILTIALMFYVIMLLIGLNGMAHNPVTMYRGATDIDKFVDIKELKRMSLGVVSFFAIFQFVLPLVQHFFIARLPLYLFITLVTYIALNLKEMVEGFAELHQTEDEIKENMLKKALEFEQTRKGKVKYYGSYTLFIVLRLIIVGGLINILFF